MAKKKAATSKDPSEGISAFFDSQAQVMLAQFNDINHLLGNDTDWTHPGTLCENLVKHSLRNLLPQRFAIDKGYVFGHSPRTKSHCPEIDLLIHDCIDYSPIYRMHDFVIVSHEAVRGIVQVKRQLSSSQLDDALKNVIAAKHFIYEAQRASNSIDMHLRSDWLFAAVIAMHGTLPRKSFPSRIHKYFREFSGYTRSLDQDNGTYSMPTFVGSISDNFALRNGLYVHGKYEDGLPPMTAQRDHMSNEIDVWASRPAGSHNHCLAHFLATAIERVMQKSPMAFFRPAGEPLYTFNFETAQVKP